MQAILTSRLAQLSDAARELAGVAATIGRSFTFDLLAGASGESEDRLALLLDELWTRRIIQRQEEDAYDFSHDKLREAAAAAASQAAGR